MMKIAERFSSRAPSGMVKMFQAIEKMDDVINLSVGEPDFVTEQNIIDAASKAASDGFTHYPPITGFRDLREAFCAYWERHHGFSFTPDEIIVTPGALYASYLVFSSMLNPGDEVMLLEPFFTPYAEQIHMAGGSVISVPISDDGPSADELAKLATPRTRAILINSPGNPSGRVIPADRLREMGAFAAERDMFVISDEIYESMVYNGTHTCFAALPGMRERTITLTGVSKSHCMTGWRIGFIAGPEDVIRGMSVIIADQIYGVNAPSQKAACFALNTNDAVVLKQSGIFKKRLEAVVERLNKMKGIVCRSPEGSFYLFPSVAGTGLSGDEFAWRLLTEAHVAVLPGYAFGKSCGDYVRIACTRSIETLTEAMDRIDAFVKGL